MLLILTIYFWWIKFLIHSVVTDFGLSRGSPIALDQQDAASTPRALDTPNRTV